MYNKIEETFGDKLDRRLGLFFTSIFTVVIFIAVIFDIFFTIQIGKNRWFRLFLVVGLFALLWYSISIFGLASILITPFFAAGLFVGVMAAGYILWLITITLYTFIETGI